MFRALRLSEDNPCELKVMTPTRTWRLKAPDHMECLMWRQVMSGCARIKAKWDK